MEYGGVCSIVSAAVPSRAVKVRLSRLFSPGFFLLLLAWTTGGAAAQDAPQLNVVFANGSPTYTPGRWTPLRLTLTNPTAADINGSVQGAFELAEGPLNVVRPVRVPAACVVQVDFLALFGTPPAGTRQGKPPVTTVIWKSQAGATIAQDALQGFADSGGPADRPSMDMPGVMVLGVQDRAADLGDVIEFPQYLQPAVDYIVSVTTIAAADFPRRLASLDACRLIILESGAVDALDPAQRQSLLDHVRSGATLLLTSAPAAHAAWLDPHLPTDYIDTRYATAVDAGGYGTLAYRAPSSRAVCELRDGATALAADAVGALAAYRPLGLGRVSMTAFPPGALDPNNPESGRLLADLVGITTAAFHDPGFADTPATAALLPAMIGQPAPAWNVAAGIAGAYTVGVAAVLLLCGARRRPFAVAACVGVGVLLAGGVFAYTAVRTADQPLLAARLARLDVTESGTVRSELLTYYGQNRDDLSFAAPDAVVRPVIAGEATVRQFPFTVEGVRASTGKLDSVWQTRGIDHGPAPLRASVAFGEKGPTAEVESSLSGPLENARIIVGGRTMPAADVAAGKTTFDVAEAGRPGDWAAGRNVLADEQTALRNDIITRTFARGANESPARTRNNDELTLAGFLTAAPPGGPKVDGATQLESQTLVRAAGRILASPVGAKVIVPPGFVRIERGPSLGLPVGADTGGFGETNQSGPWMLGLATPGQIGRLKPARVTFALDASATGWKITLQRRQCAGGRVQEDADAEVLAEWDGVGGAKLVTIDVGPDDVDENGWVWLRLSGEPRAPSGIAMSEPTQGNWHMLRFDATIEAVVTHPPAPAIMTWTDPREESIRRARATARTAAGQTARPATTRPASRPTGNPTAR